VKRLRAGVFMLAALALSGAAPVAKIQTLLAKPKVLCGRFDQSKTLAGMKKEKLVAKAHLERMWADRLRRVN